MISKRLNLRDTYERVTYSQKLQMFESQFVYPLGDTMFRIVHGRGNGDDYFSFFERLGTPSVMVMEDNDQVVGVLVAILRDIQGQSIWYLCDFKIAAAYRGKKLYRQWMRKYFLSHYWKSGSFYGINTSPKENNWFLRHTKHIFRMFNVGAEDRYLHQTDLMSYLQAPLEGYSLYSTEGKKDIVVKGVPMPVYHLMSPTQCLNFKLGGLAKIEPCDAIMGAKVMLLNASGEPILQRGTTERISFIHRLGTNVDISSAEI
jgi:hypothetical protein